MILTPEQNDELRACAAILQANADRLRELAASRSTIRAHVTSQISMALNDVDKVATRLHTMNQEAA
jgi:hypothetical protein